MPAMHAVFRTRDEDASENVSGQRVSVDGGINDKRGIVAMILATVLFIVVLILYQYLSTYMARRETQPRPRPRSKKPKTKPDESFATRLSKKFKGLFTCLKRTESSELDTSSQASSTGSMAGLAQSSSQRAGRRKAYPSSKIEAKRALRPFFLSKKAGRVARTAIDEKTQAFLRSPHAFAELPDPDLDTAPEQADTEDQHRREKRYCVWFDGATCIPERPPVAYVPPLNIRKRAEMQSQGPAVSIRAPASLARTTQARVPSVMDVRVPPQAYFGDAPASILSPRSEASSSITVIEREADKSFFDTDADNEDRGKAHKKLRFQFSLPPLQKRPVAEDAFTIGDLSDWDDSSDVSGH